MRLFALFAACAILMPPFLHADDGDLELDDQTPPVTQQTLNPAPSGPSRWSVLIPAFVIHGQAPTGGVNEQMPRRVDNGGRSVVTPGVGLEFRGQSSLNAVAAFIKDCYDDPAGTLQVGQYWRVGRATDIGYTVGLYIRETPIACYTETFTTTTPATGVGPNRQPRRTNTFTNTQCGFADNFPVRYTTSWAGTYVDIIPSPFFNFATELFRVPFAVELRFMTNFYLNEFGLSIPF